MPRQGARAPVLGVLATLLAASAVLSSAGEAAGGERGPQERPNVVVVMTDDQTLAAIEAMPRTRELIGAQGATFANSFASFPLCCPSRATLLTGQYAHNHHVRNNIPPQGGFQKLRSSKTLPVWLLRAGYYTALIGKYLNGYEDSPVGTPPGYSEWHGQKTQNAYYGYDLHEDGSVIRYGDPGENPADPSDPASYSSDVYTAKAVEFIGRRAPLRPFFLWVSYNAPHSGIPEPPPGHKSRCRGHVKPAERHFGAFEQAPLPQPPSLNEADVSDKPRSIREAPPLSGGQLESIRDFYRCELESLLAVDEGVQRIVDALAASGELDRTLVIFTSDNGMLHGEHRLPFGKNLPYEEAIRVPLMIRGPGIPAGITVSDLVANIDLAPTILDAARARPGRPQDGRSLLPIVRHPGEQTGRELVIEGNRYQGVRTWRYLYAQHETGPDAGARELYDLLVDPFQLQSLHRDPGYAGVERALAKRLRELDSCVGAECRTAPRLGLELDPGRRRLGAGGCVPGGVTAAIHGRDARRVVEAEFFVRRKPLGSDRARPHRIGVPAGRLRRSRSTAIRARVALRDGRLVDLEAKARRCR